VPPRRPYTISHPGCVTPILTPLGGAIAVAVVVADGRDGPAAGTRIDTDPGRHGTRIHRVEADVAGVALPENVVGSSPLKSQTA